MSELILFAAIWVMAMIVIWVPICWFTRPKPVDQDQREADWRTWAMSQASQSGRDADCTIVETAERIMTFARAINTGEGV